MHSAARPSASPVCSPPPVVLVAEDDDEMRWLVTRALRRDGYEVLAAPDGESVLAAMLAARDAGREPDLIVSDLRMPGMDGLSLVGRLREIGCTTPVLMVSAFAEPSTIEHAHALGVAHLLSKPFDLDDLRTVVMHLLARARAPR